MIAYIHHPAAHLQRHGQTLQVFVEGNLLRTLFLHRIEQLVLVGNLTLTGGAISLLCREKIETVFLTTHGRYKGRLEVDESKNVFLTQRQFQTLEDPTFCRDLARSFVLGKQHNMATLIGRLKRRGAKHLQHELQGLHDKIRQEMERTLRAETVEQLRGHEGQATAVFFQGLRHGLKKDWNFRKRVRRPPTDPVNSVLSFLYTLLFNRALSALRVANLHPGVGYLHALDYGRYSLVMDLVEEFRSLLAETTMLSLFNLEMLKAEDFFYEDPPPLPPSPEPTHRPEQVREDPLGMIHENSDDGFFDAPEQRLNEDGAPEHDSDGKRPCRLTHDARKRVISAFEEKLESEFHHPLVGHTVTYGEALVQQARLLREVIEGQRQQYVPLQMK